MLAGMVPVISLYFKVKVCNRVRLLISAGIVPLKWLLDRDSVCRYVRFDSPAGSVLVRLLA